VAVEPPRPARVKQRDIAARAGVSVSTVSRVLNGVSGISEALREQVRGAAEELGYRWERAKGAGLEHIALLTRLSTLGSVQGQFYTDILAGAEAECRRQGVRLSCVVAERQDSSSVVQRLKQHQVGGVLLLSVDDPELVTASLSLNVPVVLLNAEHPHLPLDTFLPDNQVGPRLAVRYLVGLGHRRILHVTNLERRTIARRFGAYRSALEEAGIPFDPALVLEIATPLSSDRAYTALKELFGSGAPDFSAVFCANDHLAIGVMHALQEQGLRIPQDVSVIGYDDIPMAALLTPPLTTVRIEREELGALAVRRLMDRALAPTLTPIRVELSTRLIKRESVGPPPA